MGLFRSIRVALQSLGANKLRSFLAILGIVIGVAAVIMMVGIGQGAQAKVERMISRMGVNLVFVWPEYIRSGHGSSRSYRAETLTVEDAEAVAELPHLRAVAPEIRRSYQIKYKNRNAYARVNGTTPEHLICRDFQLDRGRYFDRAAIRARLRVCVLGARIAEELFDDIDPVGRHIQINRQHFEVLGVLKDKGGDSWADLDESVYVPVSTAMYRLFNRTYISQITVSVEAPEYVDETMVAVEKLVLERHRIGPEDKPDIRMSSMAEMRERFDKTTRTFTMLLAGIAAISLLVGGIGIMNIMLVSVTERTREIGIRKAVGARRGDILVQFLIESTTISLLGGALGILAGVAGGQLFASLPFWKSLGGGDDWESVITLWPIALSFGFCCLVGIFFGLYPAYKAAWLHPVEALRYE